MKKKMKFRAIMIALFLCLFSGAFLVFSATAAINSTITFLTGGDEQQEEASAETDETYYTGGKLNNPAPKYTRLSSPYGYRIHPVTGKRSFHAGIDLAAANGTPIVAAESGKVVEACNKGSYGNAVVISHGNNMWTLYAHASKILVKKNQTVTRGQTIALVGSTGRSTGNHLHFEVRIGANSYSNTVNPVNYLSLN